MEEKIWFKSYAAGVKPTIEYEKLTLSEALTRSAERFPNKVALNYMGRKISYRELDRLVNRFARALQDLGVKKGDKVALCLPNLPQTVIANYATWRVGAVTVQNNPLYTERELAHQLNDSDATTLVTMTLLLPRIEKIKKETKLKRIIGCHINSYLPFPKKQLFPFVKKEMYKKVTETDEVKVFADIIGRYSAEPFEDQSRWDELAALLYTGGTTGVSKGVMLPHQKLSSNVQQLVEWFNVRGPGEVSMVGTFPIFHSAGFTAMQNLNIWQAWEHHVIPRPDPQGIIDILKKEKTTWLPGVPTIFVGLLNNPEFRKMDLSFIEGFVSGAAPLAMDTIRDLVDLTGATICEIYGLTEVTLAAAGGPWGGTLKPGTVGVPLPDTDIKIVEVESGKKEVPIGEAGEIIIKGPQVLEGYYKKPEETEKVLKDGWFYTGDIGIMDEDGYITIVDRKKDMIIAGGYNIYPLELDDILFDHPKILEACCIGVPDSYRGETVKACIVVKEGETLTEAELIAYCKEKMAAYKVPKLVEFFDDLPKSTVGKILRRKLKEMEIEKAKSDG
ncbi:MAG: long-chain fatty acid--CoA ligase [Deltaproteobacteria bacterium]|nr:long-chain fatty acid--CoA ligase [Candidatus Zymogenaceae bacterium]